jgi:hypothetical protein
MYTLDVAASYMRILWQQERRPMMYLPTLPTSLSPWWLLVAAIAVSTFYMKIMRRNLQVRVEQMIQKK